MSMMLKCNLKLVSPVFLFADASKSTHKSTHGTILCGVPQSLYTYCYYLGHLWAEVKEIYM